MPQLPHRRRLHAPVSQLYVVIWQLERDDLATTFRAIAQPRRVAPPRARRPRFRSEASCDRRREKRAQPRRQPRRLPRHHRTGQLGWPSALGATSKRRCRRHRLAPVTMRRTRGGSSHLCLSTGGQQQGTQLWQSGMTGRSVASATFRSTWSVGVSSLATARRSAASRACSLRRTARATGAARRLQRLVSQRGFRFR